MIYLRCKYDIISVPIIREAYIICKADIIASAISSVTVGNGYHCKKPLLSGRQKRFFTWQRRRDSIESGSRSVEPSRATRPRRIAFRSVRVPLAVHTKTKWPYAHTHPGAFARPWILTRAKKCSPDTFYLAYGEAALSNSSLQQNKNPNHECGRDFYGRG